MKKFIVGFIGMIMMGMALVSCGRTTTNTEAVETDSVEVVEDSLTVETPVDTLVETVDSIAE